MPLAHQQQDGNSLAALLGLGNDSIFKGDTMSLKKRQPPEDKGLANPFAFAVMAQTLILSANIVYKSYESWRKTAPPGDHSMPRSLYYELNYNIILMLYGLALDNLSKGLLIAMGIEPFKRERKYKNTNEIRIPIGKRRIAIYLQDSETEKRYNKELSHHDLNVHLSKTNVSLTHVDRQLLELLTDAIQSGKYPLDKEARLRQDAFPYLKEHSPELHNIRPHIEALVKKVTDETNNQLVVSKQFGGSLPPIDFNLGVLSSVKVS